MALNCPFTGVGCNFLTSDMPSLRLHLRDNSLHHLTQLCQGVHEMYAEAKWTQLLHTKHENDIQLVDDRLITLEHNTGSHLLWRIDGYNEKLSAAKVGAKNAVYSSPFLTHSYGYKLILLACLYGDGQAKGKFMSVFVSICRGENDAILPWPFSHKIKLTLLNQSDDPTQRNHITFVIKPNLTKENKPFVGRPQSERNASFGAQNFVDLSMMEKTQFIKDDCIFIRVDVEMDNI